MKARKVAGYAIAVALLCWVVFAASVPCAIWIGFGRLYWALLIYSAVGFSVSLGIFTIADTIDERAWRVVRNGHR